MCRRSDTPWDWAPRTGAASHARRSVRLNGGHGSWLAGWLGISRNTRLSPDPKRELGRVRSANKRAEEFGVPATLTVQEWKTTLEAFGWRCAYCETGAFEALDHFIPLTASGDTSAGNCVPICTTCNSKKCALDPSQCVARGIFTFAAVERVRAYLGNGA